MRKRAIRARLRNEFKKTPGSLNEEAKKDISKVLHEAQARFNEPELAEGIRKAFRETVLPGHKRHRELAESLRAALPIAAKAAQNPKKRHFCQHGCGESWAQKGKGFKTHSETCWYRRQRLASPLLTSSRCPAVLNNPFTPGLVAEATLFNGDKKRFYLDAEGARHMNSGRRVRSKQTSSNGIHRKSAPDFTWWHKAPTIRYRQASAREKQKFGYRT